MDTIRTQFAVIGGGPAGVSAALTAARAGVETVLIQNRPVLGGNSSSEIRVWSRGALGAGNLYGEEMGVWGELKLTNLYRNPDGNPVFWDEVLLDAVLAEKKLRLLLNTDITDLRLENGRICQVSGFQQGTERHITVEADVFLDATGDATLGALAGLPFYLGNGFLSSKLAEQPNMLEMLSCSILFNTQREDHPVPFIAPDYAYDVETVARFLNQGGRIASERMGGSDCWWFEYGGSLNTIDDTQEITLELKRLVLGVWNYIKNSGYYQAENDTLEWIGSIPGKRESRRMATAYLLTENDISTGRNFPDGAFYGGWYRDTHPAGGIQDCTEENCVQIPVNLYQIPLGCLYAPQVKNLLFAGRNIGTQREAFVSSRVMNTCALAGQAAGELAMAMLRSGKAPAEMRPEEVEKIRLSLTRQDVFIPGAEIDDDENLAPFAQATAGSVHSGLPNGEQGTLPMKDQAFVTFPGVEGKTAVLLVEAEQPGEIEAKIYLSPLPNRFLPGVTAGIWRAQLQKGRNLLEIPVPKDCQNRFCTLFLEDAPGVKIVCAAPERTGFLCGHRNSPRYQEPVLYYTTETGLYQPSQVQTAPNRPWNGSNQWLCAHGDTAPWLELRWQEEQRLGEILLFLDPNLNEELPSSRARYWQESHHFVPRDGMPMSLLRDAAILAEGSDGTWKEIGRLKDNYHRRASWKLPEPLCTKALRICVERTWGGAAAIYQVCVYGSCL